MLILFDIDGTLISTRYSGRRSIEIAGSSLYDREFSMEGIPVSGHVDPGIFRDALSANDQPSGPEEILRLREAYFATLAQVLPNAERCVLPGIHDLLQLLGARDDIVLGLLTGNFRHSGHLKLKSCGLDPELFELGAYGDDLPYDAPERRGLPPVARRRYEERYGRPPKTTLIIGDTPHDVDCAQAHGLPSLAVATGTSDLAELRETGASWAVEDFGDPKTIYEWILSINAN